ncbi:TorD/DmsD family molecular chaperone [Aestuariirhabdus litorea]|uniref:Molecular chaperone TorD n=1 Tax=Aestuariirhabdus litorea TaxID=2528527 RepID=A0A3P3VPR4_9GAMM|nr:molecular chaperone TorD family protein [Aestuariirhabdus litorea]RRJ82813.1 hypothetical protein D0544_13260 [Aestuariirhabdus litorea]RWW92972.1 hypothetical protein DZC74_13235 [Endozoicomonadaceae bacterium GTF-13]
MLGIQQQDQSEQRDGAQAAPVIDERLMELEAQAGLYRLFGRLLEGEVDFELLALLRGPLRQPLADAGVVVSPAFFEAPAEALLEALAEEYTGLMVAPGAMMPYASVFETGRMFQEPADRALAAYHEAGWGFRNRLSGEFPDHVGVMLSFYALQLQAEQDALASGAEEEAEAMRTRADRFMVEQLGRWAPGWCRLAATAALHPFYQQLLTLIGQLLWEDVCLRVSHRERLKELAELNNREPPRLDYDADFRKASGL